MQQLLIAGNVGKDPVLRNTPSGDAVLGFSLAVDNGKDKSGAKRDATWYDCSVWGNRATSLQHHITKGSKLVLSGRPTVRVHEGKAYLGLTVDGLTFMGGGGERQTDPTERDVRQPGGGPGADMGDEIPFGPEWR